METIEMIRKRQDLKAQIDALDEARKALDLQIEEAVGPGCHEVGGFSVTVTDTPEECFDSTKFKKENPDIAAKYIKERTKHIFRIVVLKAKAA